MEEERKGEENEVEQVSSEELKKAKKKKRDITIIVVLVIVLLIGYLFTLDGVKERVSSFSLQQKSLPSVQELDRENDDQFSYVIGSLFASQLAPSLDQIRDQGDAINNEIVLQAIRDVLLEKENLSMTEEQVNEFIQLKDEQAIEEFEEESQKNAQAGEDFLSSYKERDGVTETENGVLYTALEEGSGALVGENTALVSYEGRLVDDTVFDVSPDGETVPFSASQVIPGLGEVLSSMQVGDSWEIVIPSDLAYGEQGIPESGIIGPNETLIFTLTVEGIETE